MAVTPEASPRRVVVTGAGGFIGRALAARLDARGTPWRGLVRARDPSALERPSLHAIGNLAVASDDALAEALNGAYAVVHLAGRAHVMNESAPDPERAYREANVVATDRIARAAVRAGVARFVLASTVKVHGETSPPGRPLRPDDPLAPQDAYGRSKRDAEQALASAAAGSPMAPIALRLPLVYGPGAKGNFAKLLDAIAHERWLPLGAIEARRSLLYVGNLVAAIDAALAAPTAPAGAHFVADAADVSVRDLARAIGVALGQPARLVAVPVPLLRIAGALTGRRDEIARLTTPLQVDASSFARAAGFSPPYSLPEGLAATALAWRARHAI